MTKAFLIVSVACNVWFLFLLFYDRIMDMKLIRFFRHIAGLWRSLDSTVAEQGKDKEIPHADTSDIIEGILWRCLPDGYGSCSGNCNPADGLMRSVTSSWQYLPKSVGR